MTLNYAQLIGGPDAGGLLDGFRNRIINGDMRIDQRNAGASISVPATAGYSVDRWGTVETTDGTATIQQSTVVPSGQRFTNSLLYTVGTPDSSLAATQYAIIYQRIEGYNVADLNFGSASAQSVTLSFWVRSSLTGTFSGVLNNSGSDRSYPFTFSISAANTWEKKVVTVAGDTTGTWTTNESTGLGVFFCLGSGSTYLGPAGSWANTLYLGATGTTNLMGTASATFYLTGVQLEVGEVASEFQRRDYGTELGLCQRYFQKIIWSRDEWAWANNSVNDFRGTHYDFPVEMRTAPTFTVNQGWNTRESTAVFWNFPNAWFFYSNGKSWQPKKDLTGESGLTNHTQYMLRSNVGTNGDYTAVDIDVSAEL